MNTAPLRILIPVLAVVLPVSWSPAQAAPAIHLHAQPDRQSERVATLPADDARLRTAKPIMDADLNEAGWKWILLDIPRIAYLPDAKIGKDLLPVDNARLFLMPSASSPVLTAYQDGDDIEIVDSGEWWTVEITKPLPLYFLPGPIEMEDVAKEAPVTTAMAVAEKPAIEPMDEPPVRTEALPETSVKPIPLIDQQTPDSANSNENQVANEISHRFDGKFVQAKKVLGMFKPKHPFALMDPKNRRIAWMDVSEVVVPGSLESYIDKEIIVYGKKVYNEKSKEWHIIARNIRLK